MSAMSQQRDRVESGKCRETCYLCDNLLAPSHDHDHWPVANRNGGGPTMCVCTNCHVLKDSTDLKDWPVGAAGRALTDAWQNVGPLGRIFLTKNVMLYDDLRYEIDVLTEMLAEHGVSLEQVNERLLSPGRPAAKKRAKETAT